LGTLALALVLTGCSSAGFAPGGLSPVMKASDVQRATTDRQRVMAALVADAGFEGYGAPSWYDVTMAGFNYVDDRCTEYFDGLFKLNRQKDALKSSLSAFGQTTNAILSITGAASLTINVVAQAFGLASSMTDIVAGTYLFQLPPATTLKFVDETLHAYKDGAASANQRGLITGPTAAYGYIRGYLNLCLPATIEGKLVDHISGAVAIADGGRTGADLEVRVGSNNRALTLSPQILNPDEQLVLQDRPEGPGGFNPYEKGISIGQWREVQNALCIQPDGDPGTNTHRAIAAFLEGRGTPNPDIVSTGIGPGEMALLTQAIDEAAGRTCAEIGYEDAKEVGAAST
jgi:hypothetical protein